MRATSEINVFWRPMCMHEVHVFAYHGTCGGVGFCFSSLIFFYRSSAKEKQLIFLLCRNTPSGEMLTELDQSLSRHAYIPWPATTYYQTAVSHGISRNSSRVMKLGSFTRARKCDRVILSSLDVTDAVDTVEQSTGYALENE